MTSEIPEKNRHDRMAGRSEHGNLASNLGFLRDAAVLTPGQRVLEIGSGCGSMLRHLLEEGHSVQGVELDAARIEEARRLHGELPIRQVHDERLPYEADTFDVVLSFDVLEHIPDTDAHLEEVTRVLKPGGHYLLQSPNRWTNSVFETLRWRSFTKWRVHHCSLHSYRQFQRRFERHGYALEFFDVPVVTDYFRKKVRAYLGPVGPALLAVANPDRLPMPLRTNFFIKAKRVR